MSNVNIYEKSWLDLVFEGKNKAYGAYQLRQQDSRTTLAALFYGLLFLVAVSGIGLLFSSFGEKPVADNPDFVDPFIHVTSVNTTPEPKTPKTEAAAPSKPTEETHKKVLDNPTVVSHEPEDDVMTNNEAKKNPTLPEPQGTGTGLNPNPGGTTGGTAIVPATPPSTGGSDKPELVTALDVMPEYPGGIQRFYDYVGNNFDRSDIDGIKMATVIMSFVVEKDGKMTDIKVLRSPGYGLDKEAIRVLKSIRTKWKPGIKNGESVRTQYTLPITVKI